MMSGKAGVPLIYTGLIHLQLMGLLAALWFVSEDLSVNMGRLQLVRQAAK